MTDEISKEQTAREIQRALDLVADLYKQALLIDADRAVHMADTLIEQLEKIKKETP